MIKREISSRVAKDIINLVNNERIGELIRSERRGMIVRLQCKTIVIVPLGSIDNIGEEIIVVRVPDTTSLQEIRL